jgi:hypothetical protein
MVCPPRVKGPGEIVVGSSALELFSSPHFDGTTAIVELTAPRSYSHCRRLEQAVQTATTRQPSTQPRKQSTTATTPSVILIVSTRRRTLLVLHTLLRLSVSLSLRRSVLALRRSSVLASRRPVALLRLLPVRIRRRTVVVRVAAWRRGRAGVVVGLGAAVRRGWRGWVGWGCAGGRVLGGLLVRGFGNI